MDYGDFGVLGMKILRKMNEGWFSKLSSMGSVDDSKGTTEENEVVLVICLLPDGCGEPVVHCFQKWS